MQWIDVTKQASVKHAFVAYEPRTKTAAISGCATSMIEMLPIKPPLWQTTSSVDVITQWCDTILEHGFDAIFDLSVGSHGCPFVYV
jgi:hypothetical protein